MAYRVFGQRYDTSDLAATAISQRFKLTETSLILAVNVGIIFYNDPALTSLALKIYSDDNGSAKALLHTSTSRTKAAMISLDNGVRFVPFIFGSPRGVALRGGDWYHLVLSGVGYTGDSTSHIAWLKAWPDPVYDTGLTVTYPKLGIAPYQSVFIGKEMV